MYKHHFLSFPELITKPWGFHPNIHASDGQSPQIGIIPFALLCISVILSKKKKNLFVLGLIMFFFIGLFLSTQPSAILWEKFSILKKYQFPWRFIALTTVTLPMIVGILSSFKKSIVLVCICLFMVFQSLFYKTNHEYIDHPEDWYVNFPGTTFFHGETFTIWSDGGASSYPRSYVEIIDGEATIQNIRKKTQLFELPMMLYGVYLSLQRKEKNFFP
ncbi:MAG: hypothetical protein N3A54_07435, partial [Patescibacteria group bacterium]|nr:hypothetical protein [Patescibacteria group bacterium]